MYYWNYTHDIKLILLTHIVHFKCFSHFLIYML